MNSIGDHSMIFIYYKLRPTCVQHVWTVLVTLLLQATPQWQEDDILSSFPCVGFARAAPAGWRWCILESWHVLADCDVRSKRVSLRFAHRNIGILWGTNRKPCVGKSQATKTEGQNRTHGVGVATLNRFLPKKCNLVGGRGTSRCNKKEELHAMHTVFCSF